MTDQTRADTIDSTLLFADEYPQRYEHSPYECSVAEGVITQGSREVRKDYSLRVQGDTAELQVLIRYSDNGVEQSRATHQWDVEFDFGQIVVAENKQPVMEFVESAFGNDPEIVLTDEWESQVEEGI